MNIFKPIIELFSRFITLSPETLAKLDYEHPEIDHDGWYHAKNAIRMPAHSSWFGKQRENLNTIIWHYTCTKPGTAKNMAKNRLKKRNPKTDRAASWHFTIETDGSVVQMVSCESVAWHCRGANDFSIGIELVSLTGEIFTDDQEKAARELVEAIKLRYGVPRSFAGRNHSEFDPDRRKDAGPVWGVRLKRILEEVYS